MPETAFTGHKITMEADARDFATMLTAMRPTLHRYCARMTGSAIDGEDVVQEAMVKALTARALAGPLDNPEGWLFRIAHHAALDHLRRSRRAPQSLAAEDLAAVPSPDTSDPDTATASLRTFLRLPALQRSAVILKDVLGHSLGEIAAITGTTGPAAKSALQRGRARLRELAAERDDLMLPLLSDETRARLAAYVEGFKTGDFDAVRAMLADDVKLDLVARLQRRGKAEVGEYYGRYAASPQWAFAAGTVDGSPAMLVYDRDISPDMPAYFVALAFDGDRVSHIRDFLFARHAMEGLSVFALDQLLRLAL